MRRVFLYAPPRGADAFAWAAQDTDLDRVVSLSSESVLLPYAAGNAIAEEHRAVERALAASGLPWTPVHPLVLADNALNWAESVRTEGVVRLVHPEAVTAPLHSRDIAAVAVTALLGDAGGSVTALLTGSELVSQRRPVELVGAAIRRDVRAEEVSVAEACRRFGRSERPELVDAILDLIRAAAAWGSPATDTVQRALGRPAVPFAQWAREHAADFR